MLRRRIPQTPAKKIGIFGPFGYGNLGDAATQDAVIQRLRRAYPDAEIVGFSLNPRDTEARHGIKTFPISWQSWENGGESIANQLATWLRAQDSPSLEQLARVVLRAPKELGMVGDAIRALEDVDVLIFSGGGQLEDYWGNGPWSFPYTFLKWTILARSRGTRIFLLSIGAGPIRAPLSKLFIRTGVALCEYRSFRDVYSQKLVNGPDGRDLVYPDLAWGLPIESIVAASRPAATDRLVGIGPIGYLKEGCWPEHDRVRYRAYLDKMVEFIEWLLEQGHGIAFLPGEVHYDQLAVDDLMERLGERKIGGERLTRPRITTVSELLAQLAAIDVYVGSRFHGVLLAQAFAKPTIGLSYQDKVDSLMHDGGLAEHCFPVGAFDVATLKRHFGEMMQHYDELRVRLDARARACRNSLEEQYRHVFAAIGSGGNSGRDLPVSPFRE